ncbi:hypothetical protein ENSA5_52510 [Enhygromyxa salina]|uniref:Uncharacterized protein n=1 Tax=Enhygromyxa salina TaxID=215803 RepID=A0A2S9XG12_9BACT|nr:hypothetical protein [Enhygromyxa salina]PRP91814.1 hypothetical protein ENSA5_52510 [Enhygromyxa salina]
MGLLVATSMAASGCTPNTGPAATVGPAEPARRAAQSFVHCVESEGGGCVARDPKQGSWDAFALLQWLGAGSPTSILQALRRELEHHRNPFAVQDRFVVVASRYREPLRGAECTPESATPIAELLPKAVSQVETRMQSLGLWRNDLEEVVGGLAEEAETGLADGWLVHMTCYGDPYEIWVATAKRDERQVVVGMLTSMPGWLGSGPLDDERVEGRIHSRTLGDSTTLGVVREGSVDTRWIPIPIEEF